MSIIKFIIKRLKTTFDSIDNTHLQKNILNALPFWVGAFITGLVAVLYAKLFYWAEQATKYIYVHERYSLLIITPVAFALSWWMVSKYAPFSRGSGIPQVSASIELSNPKHNYKVNNLLSLRIIIVKILSSLVMVVGGGVVGREGPTIQIAASIFKKINDVLPAWYPKISKQSMLVTGAAAGLASAFNTPLGGIVFAIEELTKKHFNFFKSALLTGVIIAGLTALNLFGPYLYLGYPVLDNFHSWIFLIVILVALVSGISGSGMGVVVLFILRRKRILKENYKYIIFALIAGFLLAILGVFINADIFGSGKEIMINTLFTDNKSLPWYVPILRIVGTIISFSNGAAGGIFAPSLSAGASIGAVLAGWFQLAASDTNLIILCGMVGVLTGITRSPFTSSILVIEMTNSHNIIFYVMLTALLANMIATMITRHSFYDHLKDQYIDEIHKSETQLAAEKIPEEENVEKN